MIDLALLRNNTKQISNLITKKNPDFDVQQLVHLDADVRAARQEVETLRAQKNELAKKAQGGITDELRAQSIEVGKQLKAQEHQLQISEQQFQELYLSCPNIIFDDVPIGNKESNVVIKEVGQKPSFDFDIKNHIQLAEHNDWLDFGQAAKIAASNFALYKDDAVKLMYALTMFMLKNNIHHGYQLILPPVMVNETSLTVSGNFPKFKDQVFEVGQDNLFLTPTAEVGLANMYRDHIFLAKELPKRMTSWTSCFRREAGAYGSTERGLIRIHQFEKVELYTICKPEESPAELERMLACAESILQKLQLHYRVSLLAAQDCSFQSAKTYDIEVWLPAQKEYYEVSSVSNCTDFQARRGQMRYKETPDGKTKLVHTLNGSSLALPRLMVALMETYQQADGSIKIPDVLKQDLF